MKTTILYALIAILFFGSIATGLTTRSNTNHRILLQTTDIHTTAVQLNQSAEIISNRLTGYGTGKFEVSIDTLQNKIQITLDKQWDINSVEKLVLQKGNLEFYETYTLKSLMALVKNDSTLLSLFKEKTPDYSKSELGCISTEKVNEVNRYLNTLIPSPVCRFAWTNIFDQSEACLYALKTNNGKGAVLVGSNIDRFEIKQDASFKNEFIGFNFNKSSVELWSQLTKNNLNHSIAIVLDNQVLFTPVVRSQINNGHCQISGDFTHDQLKYLVAIGNSGELPVAFQIVK